MKKVVDAMGKQCPIPVLEANKAIAAMEKSGVVVVHVDNETAVNNLKRLADKVGGSSSIKLIEEGHYEVSISIDEKTVAEPEETISCDIGIPACDNIVVVFDGEIMGRGSDELGKTLLKGFVYALSQLDKLPKTCLFYNSGAKLTADDSDVLEDIRAMEQAGVIIKTCGTCANFYGLEDKIKVGIITNMYDIVETMNDATKIIRP